MGALRLVAGRRWLPVSYTDEQREEAAVILSLWASNPGRGMTAIESATEFEDESFSLALAAWDHYYDRLNDAGQDHFAEAESWVRCGWSQPGDEENR